jgi:hypothetical protein
MNKLLKNQLSAYYMNGNEFNAELLDVFNMISQTYEFYEKKLTDLQNASRASQPLTAVAVETEHNFVSARC